MKKQMKIIEKIWMIMMIISLILGLIPSIKVEAKSPAKTKITSVKVNSSTLSATIKWNRIKNVTGYKIYRSTSKTKGYKYIKTIKVTKKNKNQNKTTDKISVQALDLLEKEVFGGKNNEKNSCNL